MYSDTEAQGTFFGAPALSPTTKARMSLPCSKDVPEEGLPWQRTAKLKSPSPEFVCSCLQPLTPQARLNLWAWCSDPPGNSCLGNMRLDFGTPYPHL